MTLNEIRTMLVAVDPDIRHYFSTEKTKDYTYWEESQRLAMLSDDEHDEGWRFYVHRFTKHEYDPIAGRLFNALDADPRTTVSHTVDYEPDSGYIHHIFSCEGY